jgi:hypothetical protein
MITSTPADTHLRSYHQEHAALQERLAEVQYKRAMLDLRHAELVSARDQALEQARAAPVADGARLKVRVTKVRAAVAQCEAEARALEPEYIAVAFRLRAVERRLGYV